MSRSSHPPTIRWTYDLYWPTVPKVALADQEAPPAARFLLACPEQARQELLVTITEVIRFASPTTYHRVAKGRWEAMQGEMAGIFEARDRHGDTLYRLFAFFDEAAGAHGGDGPTLVL